MNINDIIEIATNHPYAFGITAFALWFLSGLYGLYLSTWNTKSHSERLKLIKEWQVADFKERPYYYAISLTLFAAALGPVWYVLAKAHYLQYRIRQNTVGKQKA